MENIGTKNGWAQILQYTRSERNLFFYYCFGSCLNLKVSAFALSNICARLSKLSRIPIKILVKNIIGFIYYIKLMDSLFWVLFEF